jgi:hypothetical protein
MPAPTASFPDRQKRQSARKAAMSGRGDEFVEPTRTNRRR